MTSRFRNNWAKEGAQSMSSTFHSSGYRESDRALEDDFRRECYERQDENRWRSTDRGIYRDRSIEKNRNGKSTKDRGPGSTRYDKSTKGRESPNKSHRDKLILQESRCHDDDPEVEECPAQRERRTPIGEKSSSNASGTSTRARRYDLDESPNYEEMSLDSSRLESSLINGNSTMSTRTNGSAKQVNRIDNSSINLANVRSGDPSNGTERDRSKRWMRNDRKDDYQSPSRVSRFREIDDGSLDRGTRSERSSSPVERFVNGSNGDSLDRYERKSERVLSPVRKFEGEEDDRRSRRHADGRSYSSTEEYNSRMSHDRCETSSRLLENRSKCHKDENFGSGYKKSASENPEDRDSYDENFESTNNYSLNRRANGNRRENGNSNKYSDEDDHQSAKVTSGKKSHARYKASPEEFDVQIHRYERALRAPRRDSNLSRKSSFKGNESDLSRKNSFEEQHRSKDSRRNNYRLRNSETHRRGSSEDRDHSSSRNSSFKNSESIRKSSITKHYLDTGPIANNNNNQHNNNNHRRKNGSHEKTEILRREAEEEEDEEEDRERFWLKERHSRPLTPPKLGNIEDRRVTRNLGVSSSSKERASRNKENDDCARDHNDRRSPSDETLFFSRRNSSGAHRAEPIGTKTRDDDDDEDDHQDDATNLKFSTIERNGTTVIRIGRNSESPDEPMSEPRGRRRTSHRELVNAMRYRKYEDEAEDEDEDDETFYRNDQRKGYRAPGRRLWTNRDAGVQITDLDEGQPCLHCGETCPGFSPHSWRKNCTSCKCPREAHDVCHEEWVSVRARLGLKGEGSNNYVGFDPRDRGLTWAPPGLSPSKVEEYFSMLPEISVPRIGTPGERHRDRQLATQLPKQDLARAYCRHLDSQHSASADDFMAARNEIALDIGTVKEILERGHTCGVCHEALKYGSLVVSASKLGLSYHPSCFQCTQCRELLVDLAYCVHDDALYCERHYAEQLKPRCAACDELIFSGEYTKAMNKDWHSGHFCCWQCDESLTGQRYVLRDEHPYCIKCYESVFANGCEECNKIIGIDSKDLSYKDKHWHEACFLCNKCRVSLVDKQFGSKVDKIYCGNCYDAQFASRCDGCGEIFRAGTKKMEYKTRQWHEKCFCCVVCKNPIGTKSFIPREQEIYCAGCYEDKFATRCVKCNKIITSGGVTYKNEPWHRDCFTCNNCDHSLAGQRFTSRDDKPYCAECFGELFAKRCTACTKPITGIGGTRFISFEDRHWHNNCFICAGCNTSLVGRGFITDGNDVICPECAKQKLTE